MFSNSKSPKNINQFRLQTQVFFMGLVLETWRNERLQQTLAKAILASYFDAFHQFCVSAPYIQKGRLCVVDVASNGVHENLIPFLLIYPYLCG